MKRYIARRLSITTLLALALLTLCFVQLPIGAGALESATARMAETSASPLPLPDSTPPGDQRFQDIPPVGFVFGQTLHVTVAHIGTDAEQNQTPPNVRVGVWLLDASGRVIAQSAQAPIPLNEFRSFDFNRAAFNLPGEPGTGRLQVRARLVMHVAEPYDFTAEGKASSLLVPSLELIDNGTGRTAQQIRCTNNLKQIALASH